MAFSNKFQGYVADVPEVWFKRMDGKVFHFDKITQASATPNVNFTEVQAGQGLYPVAYLPAAATMEISLTSGQFDSSMFAMANGSDFEDAKSDTKVPRSATVYFQSASNHNTYASTYTIPVGSTVNTTIPSKGIYSDVFIDGLTQVASSAELSKGQFKAVYTANTGEGAKGGNLTITLADTEAASGIGPHDPINVTWFESAPEGTKQLKVSNTQAAIGEAILQWPKHIWAA